MSIGLDPIVISKLQRFQRRRQSLLLARGVAAGLVAFLLCFSVIAAIDWYWLLSENTRWTLSVAGYLIVAVVVWLTSLRRLLHNTAREEIASQLEQAEPELRENLLSAVELAADDPSVIHDSPTFRGLLQGKVAQLMGQVRVPKVLPVRLVLRWVVPAVALTGVAAFLLTAEDERFRQLATRAMLPGANIARVSRIQVEVLQPTPHSLMLAENETLAVIVDVTGGRVDEVTLETYTEQQGTVRQLMRGRTETEYATNLQIADEAVEYRILAGDAITQWFRIDTRPRPRVLAFHKTYHLPDYARMEAETVTESHGDLITLEGTRAELVLDLDQPVSRAELRIDPVNGEEPRVVALSPADGTREEGMHWRVSLPIEEAGIYQVHLVSEETGFENPFSPKYEIRPRPDLVPRTGFVDQRETTLLLPPNDIVALKGMAEDDLPLDQLEQQMSINGREWESLPLETRPAIEADQYKLTASWDWDLLNHSLKTGDQIVTKLVATDRKGNIGESIPLRIIVAAEDFDPERHAIMELKLSLNDDLNDFAQFIQEQSDSALEVVEQLQADDLSDEDRKLHQQTLLDIAAKQRDQAAKLLERVREILRQMPAGADAHELDLVGRLVGRIQLQHTQIPVGLLRALPHGASEKDRASDFDMLTKSYKRIADDAQQLEKAFDAFSKHNYLAALAIDLDAIRRHQELVVNSPTQTWDRLLRQETVVHNQLLEFERLIRVHRPRTSGTLNRQLNQLLSWTSNMNLRLKEAMESEERLGDLKRVSTDLLRDLDSRKTIDNMDGGLPNQITNARGDMTKRAGGLYVPLDELGRAIESESKANAAATAAEDSAESRKFLAKAERARAIIEAELTSSVRQLRTRKELTQLRSDQTPQSSADHGLTHRAIDYLLNREPADVPDGFELHAALLEIAPAYRTLEAGHQLMIADKALDTLLTMERWDGQSIQAQTDHPRQWDLVQKELERASEMLRNAKYENSIVDQLNRVRWSEATRAANRKISERRWNRDLLASASHELARLRDELAQVSGEVAPVMAEARTIIAKYAPTIPEMAKQAAVQVRSLEEETVDAAEALEKTPDSQQQTERLDNLSQAQHEINERVNDLLEALVEDANAQDLLDEQQRERARDADDSIAMIQEQAKQMNRAMEQAQDQADAQRQAQDLSRAAEEQEETAEALELVAEHFERLEQGDDVPETREELRKTEREQGLARQMEQKFEPANQLGEMARTDPQALMEQLEAELENNPAMRQELSNIAEKTLKDARNSLELAARDENNIQAANERADEQFKQKKKELAQDTRKLADDANRLANGILANAKQSADRGQAEDAEQNIEETRKQLQEIARKASQANENNLLNELDQLADETKEVLKAATETLKQAKRQTDSAEEEAIHDSDRSRENAKKTAERNLKNFHEQQKRTARDLVKRADDAKRNADRETRRREDEVKRANQEVNKAQQNLNKQPDDKGRKRALADRKLRQAEAEQRLENARRDQKRAEEQRKQAREELDRINRKKLPKLDKANPEAQLADDLTEEAIAEAERLNKEADQLAKSADFENELSPEQNQLATAQQQQGDVKQDVQQVAEDVARAARHEARLNNQPAAEALQETAKEIDAVANNEATKAENELGQALEQAKQDQPDGRPSNRPNGEAVQAQQALEQSEAAIANQANQVGETLEELNQQADANAAAGPTDATQSEAGQQQAGTNSPNQADPQPATNPASGQQAATPAMTAEELANAQQMARTLDELDRQMAARQNGEAQTAGEPAPTISQQALAQAAQAQQQAMAASRVQSQQQAAQALSENGTESSDNPATTGPMGEFELENVARNDNSDWGKLRSKSAEDLSKGKSATVSEEYRKSVEAYFKVLAERARKK